MAFRPGILRGHSVPVICPLVLFAGLVFHRNPPLLLVEMIEKKIVQDLGQPGLHVTSGSELLIGGERPNTGLLNDILGLVPFLCQVKAHPVEMIHVCHELLEKCFSPFRLSSSRANHAAILTKRKPAVQLIKRSWPLQGSRKGAALSP